MDMKISKDELLADIQVVDTTNLWTRPSGFPSAGAKDDFVNVVEENASIFSEKTAAVAMKYEPFCLRHSCIFNEDQLILKQGIRASE